MAFSSMEFNHTLSLSRSWFIPAAGGFAHSSTQLPSPSAFSAPQGVSLGLFAGMLVTVCLQEHAHLVSDITKHMSSPPSSTVPVQFKAYIHLFQQFLI